MINFAFKVDEFLYLKRGILYQKTRNFVFKMMDFAAAGATEITRNKALRINLQ